ncbi:uncharacterized protein LOC107215815 [Parus major]|uniref:uncharacterized protein LOC107215815 n=1 Tax=Parus major TaxID=9157 RepID=UPI0007714B96|nr:uncharacterized protein LOC107215815 [Parus major]
MRALGTPHSVPRHHKGKVPQEEPEQMTNHRNVQVGMSQEMGITLAPLHTAQQRRATVRQPRHDRYEKQQDAGEFKAGVPDPEELCSWNRGPSGPAPTQKSPDGPEPPPCASRGCEWRSQGEGRVAGHLLAQRRPRGPSRGALERISPLLSFFPRLGPFHFKDPLALGSAGPARKARLRSRAQAPEAPEPGPQQARATVQAEPGLAGGFIRTAGLAELTP